jgi:hypothetical protein
VKKGSRQGYWFLDLDTEAFACASG